MTLNHLIPRTNKIEHLSFVSLSYSKKAHQEQTLQLICFRASETKKKKFDKIDTRRSWPRRCCPASTSPTRPPTASTSSRQVIALSQAVLFLESFFQDSLSLSQVYCSCELSSSNLQQFIKCISFVDYVGTKQARAFVP